MSEMMKRAVGAIKALYPGNSSLYVYLGLNDEVLIEPEEIARAVIEAMWEGDNGMWREGARYFSVPDSMPRRMQMVRDAFRAMITLALKKG